MSHQTLPRLLGCRIRDRGEPELMVSALGNVKTPLEQGVFDRQADRLTERDGRVIADYFKRRLGVRHYRLLPSTRLPPAGWCSWGYYFRSITPEEVMLNARWIHDHLGEHGAALILLDDGWQAGKRERDWTSLAPAFRGAMARLARDIRQLGQLPGIWICPQGQDNAEVVRQAGCFLLKPDGTPLGGTFGGPFTVDPTHPRARAYWQALIRRLTVEWGYGYLKLDGIHSQTPGHSVQEAYAAHRAAFHDASVTGEAAFRRFLHIVRSAAGPGVAIAGCGVLTFAAAGLCEACRTGSDVHAQWRGFERAWQATMDGYFMHRLVWLSDPDYVLVRPPLTLETARAWASLVGLTGQQLTFGDRMPDLGAPRVALLKKITPSAPIRPFDLFPSRRRKRMLDLKVAAHGRSYDVVGLFNDDDRRSADTWVNFAALGLPAGSRCYVYDFWADDVLGVCAGGVNVGVPPRGCRVLTVTPRGDTPILLSTTRHITQGWPDLAALATGRRCIRGRSRVIAGEPYGLVFGLVARDGRRFEVADVTVAGVPRPDVSAGDVAARVAWTPRQSGTVSWRVAFRPAAGAWALGGSDFTAMPSVRDVDPWTVEVAWGGVLVASRCCAVKMDGRLVGHVFGDRCRISGLRAGSRHQFEVVAARADGALQETGAPRVDVVVGAGLPRWLPLSDLPWRRATCGYLTVQRDRNVSDGALACGGSRHARGLGTFPPSTITYGLQKIFRRLRGAVGIDDINGAPPGLPSAERGRARFSIWGDGRRLWGPVQMDHGRTARRFDIDVRGVGKLELRVDAADQRSFAPFANWLDVEAERG